MAHPTRSFTTRLTGEDGFSLVELMVASLVLIVGMLGVLTMLTGALGTTATSNKRVAATNLARELVETTRGLDYDVLDTVTTQLQTRGLGAGSPWTIERRNVAYTVAATTCSFDDPADGYATTAPANACNTNTAGADTNGDDFRRVTFTLAWNDGGTARNLKQTTLIVNPTGGLGPRITDINPLTQTITNPAVTSVDVTWTTTPAVSLKWNVDDGVGAGTVSGSTSFLTTWNIGTVDSADEVYDGSYTMSAEPFDARDIAGEAKRANILLNRRAPHAPTNFQGGHDTRINEWVDFEWSLNPERDILGYRVVWAGPDGIGNGNDKQVCPAPADGPMLPRNVTSCADFDPPNSGSHVYYVVAVDRDDSNELRDGDSTMLTVPAAGSRPGAPVSPLTVATFNDMPRLTWNPPATGGVAFYRIYRGGTSVGYDDRYDTTSGNETTFDDSSPPTTATDYWVTAVDSTFNESDPIGPVTWTP